jgi:hypothetical protein
MTTYSAGHSFGNYIVTRNLGRGGMAEVYTIYNQIQTSAARIADEAMRRSYLENVPAHRAIVRAWEALPRPHTAPKSADVTEIE